MEDRLSKWVVVGLAVLVVLVGVGVLNKPEQTRPLSYDKGTYSGSPDTSLDSQTVETLRQRTNNYRNSGI